jgi:hypothetical protein
VKIDNGLVYAYYCDEDGKNLRKFSRHLKLSSVLAKIKLDRWEIISISRPKKDQIIYMLQRSIDDE